MDTKKKVMSTTYPDYSDRITVPLRDTPNIFLKKPEKKSKKNLSTTKKLYSKVFWG